MPYIQPELRPKLDIAIDELVLRIRNETENDDKLVCGILNYCITRIILSTILRRFGKVRYHLMCMVDGILANISQEIYRRVTVQYEELKEFESGDVKEFVEIDNQLHAEKKKLQGIE